MLSALNISKGHAIVARELEWAGTSQDRRRGLSGRDCLPTDRGIYIAPSQWIHTFGMRFAIDVAFLSEDGHVLAVHHGLKPNRLSKLMWRADGALELAAGRLAATGTEVGDIILFEEAPSQ